jgi:predicted negative regulator of RcsB-dependent stress response
MAEEEPKRTRRAQRRAAQADAGEAAPPDDDVSDAAPKQPAAPAEKRKKKAASAEEIRDRNRRLREEAAARRRDRREREHTAVASGLDASEMVDDALARSTHAVTQFVKRHFNIVQWIVVLAIVGGIGWQIYSWRSGQQEEKASDVLMTAAEAEQGTVAGTEPAPREEENAEPRPTFQSDQARLAAAETAYRAAAEKRPGSGTSLLARMGLAGVLYDQGKFEQARQEYDAVKTSSIAAQDIDLRGRALEGLGLSLEGKGNRDAALKAFRELENLGGVGFDALGLYHQARVLYAKKEQAKAKELAQKVVEKLEKASTTTWQPSHLAKAARELLYTIDPASAPAGTAGLSPEAVEQLKQQFLKDPAKMQKFLQDMTKQTKDLAGQAAAPIQLPPTVPTPPAPPASKKP